jgi:hypothetical protein
VKLDVGIEVDTALNNQAIFVHQTFKGVGKWGDVEVSES